VRGEERRAALHPLHADALRIHRELLDVALAGPPVEARDAGAGAPDEIDDTGLLVDLADRRERTCIGISTLRISLRSIVSPSERRSPARGGASRLEISFG
jgi:hypothetical protein